MNASSTQVAIIGAGPYGLGLATYLRQRRIGHRIFGYPMQTWRDMPSGMYLKSLGFATTIPTAQPHPTFPEYCRKHGLEDYEPIEFATFVGYGVELQQRLVPYLEETLVDGLEQRDGHFALTLKTGAQVMAEQVVVAVGLSSFRRIPAALAGLPEEFVGHTSQVSDFAHLCGKDVVVLGAGASALEAAALLHEQGARVTMLVRGEVKWGWRGPRESERRLFDRIRNPISTLGHGRENWVLQHLPALMYHLPDRKRLPFTRVHLGPSGAWWLRERVEGKLPIRCGAAVTGAEIVGGKVMLQVSQPAGMEELVADYVLAGTGYEVDVDRLPFLAPNLARRVEGFGRAPKLSRQFESSVRGLYFIGPAAAASFGPLVRFVAGSQFAVTTVARHLAGRSSEVSRTPARRSNAGSDQQEEREAAFAMAKRR